MLQEKKLECILNKPKAIQFMGDGDKLARAFGNLLKNAINYSYLNTTIKIDIKEYEDKIEIVFKNKGDKIPEYKLEKIFDKFYRADESRTSSTGESPEPPLLLYVVNLLVVFFQHFISAVKIQAYCILAKQNFMAEYFSKPV